MEDRHEEWLKKIREASNPKEGEVERVKEKNSLKLNLKQFRILIPVFLIALIPRVVYMFFLSDPIVPGWYTDTFHHWQVAFLSKEIGFSNGFLRLWDFKGMEFFWGLLHPLLLAILFFFSGSTSIIIPRLLTIFAGSLSIVFLFILISRYFNQKTAWTVALFASFFPLTLFSNTVGMQEELGFVMILGGFLLWPSNPIAVGILFALASMVRSEYWLFCVGLIIAALMIRRNLDKVFILFVSYTLLILIYMKYLATYTNNFIYPIYWNFLASVKGEWFADLPIIGEKLMAKRISQGIFGFGVIGAVITVLKRPKYSLLFLLGFGNIIFIGFMVGFGSYVKGYIPRYWVDRLYNWPYLFTAILILILLFYIVPKKLPTLNKLKVNWLVFIIMLSASQLIWLPINQFMEGVGEGIYREKAIAAEIGINYKGGSLLLPEDRAQITYFLANDYGVKGKDMRGQMFDPFYYFPDKENPFSNWGEDRKVVLDWLKKENIKLIALTTPKPTYIGLFEREKQKFEKIPSSRNIILYKVK